MDGHIVTIGRNLDPAFIVNNGITNIYAECSCGWRSAYTHAERFARDAGTIHGRHSKTTKYGEETMTPLLWSDTVMNTNGTEYTLEVRHDWMAGHGVFTDAEGNPNRWRWAVYCETQYRPAIAYQYGVGSLGRAIELGTAKLYEWRDKK